MKNKLRTLLALLLVTVMALSVVACDMDTGTVEKTDESEKSTEENGITFSIDTSF